MLGLVNAFQSLCAQISNIKRAICFLVSSLIFVPYSTQRQLHVVVVSCTIRIRIDRLVSRRSSNHPQSSSRSGPHVIHEHPHTNSVQGDDDDERILYINNIRATNNHSNDGSGVLCETTILGGEDHGAAQGRRRIYTECHNIDADVWRDEFSDDSDDDDSEPNPKGTWEERCAPSNSGSRRRCVF